MRDRTAEHDRLYVAVLTPYKDGTYDPDEQQLRHLIRGFLRPEHVEAGIALIINPEAGDVFYLNREEKRRNAEIAVDEVEGRVPVFAGAIDNTTAGTVEAAMDAREAGADGLFLMPPMGAIDVTTSWDAVRYPEVWGDIIKEVVRATGDMPVLCHPTAAPSPVYGFGVPLEPALELVGEIENIVGWKMTYSYGGYRLVARALRQLERHVGVLGAVATYFHENLAAGQFDGTVTGSFNYALEPMMEHIRAWRDGDLTRAREIWEGGLAQLHEYVYSDHSRLHIRYKTAAWVGGRISNPFMRPPMPRPNIEEVERLHELVSGAGMDVVPLEELRAVLDSPPAVVRTPAVG